MVIGNGLLATKFEKYAKVNDIVIFASGVSNSNEKKEKEFEREENLLRSIINDNKEKQLVYFSSCDVANNNINHLKYYQHKRRLENIIETNCNYYLIFRLPQVVGLGGNSNNLLNYFVQNITKNRTFDAFIGTKKNILDIDDAFKIIDFIITNNIFKNQLVNILNKNYYCVMDIIRAIEIVFKAKAIFNKKTIDIGWNYDSDINSEIIKSSNVEFGNNYIENLLLKYFVTHKIK